MYVANGGAERARWQVLWIKDGRLVTKDFGCDLAGALRLYNLAERAGRNGVTLRCKNMGFPPPEHLQSRIIEFDKPRLIKGERRTAVRVTPMLKLNDQGIWWCPYCMKLRRFKRRSGFYVEGIWVPEPGMHCPICKASHRDWHVKKHNPIALRISARVADPTRRRVARRGRRRRERTEEE